MRMGAAAPLCCFSLPYTNAHTHRFVEFQTPAIVLKEWRENPVTPSGWEMGESVTSAGCTKLRGSVLWERRVYPRPILR